MYKQSYTVHKIIFGLFLMMLSAALHAKQLQSIKTEHFEIIYAESSAPSAALLAEYADGYADEICAALHKQIKHRIPVYLVSDTEELNGYFTRTPYNRIVIYDTGITDGQLGNLTDTLLQVFYHELTHAVSLDAPFSLLNLLPMSFTEGVAVSFESLHGQGRLHDPLIKQYLIQNKIDGITPTWTEAASSRDMYPGGLWPYIYGGAFSDYLQKTYGMDTYAQLWKLSWRLFITGKFKSLYNKDIRVAWNQFINTIPLPDKLTEPHVFDAQPEKSGYTALAAGKDGFAYYDFNRQAVYFMQVTQTVANGTASSADLRISDPVKLFTADSLLNYLSFSEDGSELIVADSIATSGKTMQKRIRIFDMHTRRFTGEPLFSGMAACFVDEQTLCAVMLKNQAFSVVLLDRSTHEIKKTLYTAGPGEPFAALYSPCFIGNGSVALIAANGVKRTILRIDTDTGAVSMLPGAEAPYAIRYLQSVKSGSEYLLTFSWAEMDMLYRLGLYYPQSGVLKTQQIDVSGGVFFPVVLQGTAAQAAPATGESIVQRAAEGDASAEGKPDGQNNHTIIYVGQHGTYHQLYTMEETALAAKTVQAVQAVGAEGIAALTVQDAAAQSPEMQLGDSMPSGAVPQVGIPASKAPQLALLKPSPYNPASWLWRAKVRPAFSMPSESARFGGYGVGLSLSMLDPTEMIEINPSVVLFPKPFFTQVSLKTAFHFKPLSLHINAFDQLDAKTFRYRTTGFRAGISGSVPLAYVWENLQLGYRTTAAWIAPLSDIGNTYYPFTYRYTVLSHEATLNYRNIRSSRVITSPFFAKQTRGIAVSGSAAHAYCVEKNTNAAVFQTKVDGFIPVVPIRLTASGYFGINARFNPLSNVYSHIAAGFPVAVTDYFPELGVYNTAQMRSAFKSAGTGTFFGGIAGVCDITFFSYEIQTGGFLPLFLNRISLHTGYAGMLNGTFAQKQRSTPLYLDTVYINALLTFNGIIDAGIEYAHPMRTPERLGSIRAVIDAKL